MADSPPKALKDAPDAEPVPLIAMEAGWDDDLDFLN
jgi:hypothetical protein